MCAFGVLGLVFSIPSQEIDLGKRLQNDLSCVECDVKPQLNQWWDFVDGDLLHVFAADVTQPRVLRDWSTIGSTSVSVVWRCNSNVRNIDAFLLYYRPLCNAEKKRRPPQSLDPAQLTTLTDADFCAAGFFRIRVHRFVPKRSQAVLRHLQSATDYVLVLFAVNELACSLPSVFFFQTAPSDKGFNNRTLSRRRPICRPLCSRMVAFAARFIRTMLSFLFFIYIIMSVFLIVVHRDAVYNDLCFLLSWTELSHFVCPDTYLEPSEETPHMPHESYFTWLYNVFSNWCCCLVITIAKNFLNMGNPTMAQFCGVVSLVSLSRLEVWIVWVFTYGYFVLL